MTHTALDILQAFGVAVAFTLWLAFANPRGWYLALGALLFFGLFFFVALA